MNPRDLCHVHWRELARAGPQLVLATPADMTCYGGNSEWEEWAAVGLAPEGGIREEVVQAGPDLTAVVDKV